MPSRTIPASLVKIHIDVTMAGRGREATRVTPAAVMAITGVSALTLGKVKSQDLDLGRAREKVIADAKKVGKMVVNAGFAVPRPTWLHVVRIERGRGENPPKRKTDVQSI